jgi:hypothetical protein
MIIACTSRKITGQRREPSIETAAALQNFARRWFISVCRMLFAVWRRSAQANECEVGIGGGHRLTTERRPDKRPHIAARSVGCFSWVFVHVLQCARDRRNVYADIKPLLRLVFFNIAEIVNGA